MAIDQVENWYGTALGFSWIILAVFMAIMIFLVFFVKEYLFEPIKHIENYLATLIEEGREIAIPPQKSFETESVVKSLKRLTGHVKEEGKRRIFHTAGVAHDLRSPLSALLSALELVKLKIGKKDDNQIGENIESAERQVERVNILIDQFIEASKIQSGELSLDIQDCDLKKLAESSIKQLKEIHPDRKIELKGEKVDIKCDPQRIEQVINNLIINAIKYSKSESLVTVELTKKEPWATVKVEDRGEGISQEEIEEIFLPFKRAKTSKKTVQGSGLGLSNVKRIVDEHGGQISVESEVGKGSKFYIHLPLGDSVSK